MVDTDGSTDGSTVGNAAKFAETTEFSELDDLENEEGIRSDADTDGIFSVVRK